jgi:putative ATP-binding cassette transporter
MTNKNFLQFKIMWMMLAIIIYTLIHPSHSYAVKTEKEPVFTRIEEKVQELMEKGDIPGLSLAFLIPDEPDVIKGFGYADLEKKNPVTPDTLFELASCSKSFTALAALQLENQGLLNLDAPVSRYLPWFYVLVKKKKVDITLRQALHHTSGIPWDTIQGIPMGDDDNALQQTVRNIVGIELDAEPGTRFQYATINYDIIGLVIEKASGMSYEDYMEKHVFKPLGLSSTKVGVDREAPFAFDKMAAGYKIGFFAPRKYQAPPYRGNNPAGYIVSNGRDMARWLKLQMGMIETPLTSLIQKTQQRDKTVTPNLIDISSYAMGWQVSLTGDDEIRHAGLNPNFTAYVAFRPGKKIGVAVLANSNSNYTTFIGRMIMNMLCGIETDDSAAPAGTIDGATSVISIILFIIILIIVAFIGSIVVDLSKRRRQFEPLTWKKIGKIVVLIPILVPFLVSIYLLPYAMANVSWKFSLVWSPVSFKTAVVLLLTCLAAIYLAYVISLFFPQKSRYFKSIPLLILLSMLSGGANAMIIFLITGSLYTKTKLIYLLYYFGLAIVLYILGRKVVQTELTKITYNIVYDLRMKLIEKIFYTSYQQFEKLDRGRILATLNDDTAQVGSSAREVVTLLTSLITIIGAFIYLSAIAFWATLVTLGVIILIASLYYIVSQKAEVYLEEARDTRNVFMNLLSGMIDGFKELSIHFNKKREYRDDVEKSNREFRQKRTIGMVKFINAFLIGECMLVAVLGAVAFAVPRLFTNIQTITLMSFIMVLLYLIGPISGVLNSIPNMMQLKVAWRRVQSFIRDIPANMKPEELEKLELNINDVKRIEAKGVMFQYESRNGDKAFILGPLDFEAKKGEIVFIVGGNGSGKTTLAKLLTGLYIPEEGIIKVDGKEVNNCQLGEYYSTVFSGYHLFEKLYNIDLSDNNKKEEAEKHLKMLRIQDKVSFKEDTLSTIDLSGGQRKRLALLLCYLEDCPIYLFDEVAADQDPEFRRFFYKELLPQMKEKGKIVIAITHDDHYFDAADKIIKMDMGKIDTVERLKAGIEKGRHLDALQLSH